MCAWVEQWNGYVRELGEAVDRDDYAFLSSREDSYARLCARSLYREDLDSAREWAGLADCARYHIAVLFMFREADASTGQGVA